MFGLTKREQRWKADQQVAEVLSSLTATALRAVADVRIAEAKTDTEELARLRSLAATLVRCTVRNSGSTQVLIAKHMGEDFSRAMRDLGA